MNCMRAEARTNLFVMAKLAAGGSVCTVKVRNISSGGALVEGAALPPPGTPCRLIRGDISLEAQIVWLQASRVGLQLGLSVVVANEQLAVWQDCHVGLAAWRVLGIMFNALRDDHAA